MIQKKRKEKTRWEPNYCKPHKIRKHTKQILQTKQWKKSSKLTVNVSDNDNKTNSSHLVRNVANNLCVFFFVQWFQFIIVIVVTVCYGIHILLYISAIHKLFMLKIISYLRTHRNIALNTTHSLRCSSYKTKKTRFAYLLYLHCSTHRAKSVTSFHYFWP